MWYGGASYYAMSGTDIQYAVVSHYALAMSCPVLTQAVLLPGACSARSGGHCYGMILRGAMRCP
eukprot:1926455-Rhodomonas_salina.1